MQPPSCAERHPILASVGVPVLAVIVAYWWSVAAVVVAHASNATPLRWSLVGMVISEAVAQAAAESPNRRDTEEDPQGSRR